MHKLFAPDSRYRLLADLLSLLPGSFLVAAGLILFTIPNNIAPGGVSGLATALAHITPIRLSLWTLALNLPLLLWAWRSMGGRSLALTLLSTLLLSAFLELFAFLPQYQGDVLMAAVFGGVLMGLGVGLLFLRGISTGGTDLLALLLRPFFPNVPAGTMLLVIDAVVVALAVLVFREIEVALSSTICIFVSSKVIDALAQGLDYAKVIFVVSSRAELLTEAMNRSERGCTLLPATGGYTGENRTLLVTVTRRNELAQKLRLIKSLDPEAFTFVTNATEVHGEGFKLDL